MNEAYNIIETLESFTIEEHSKGKISEDMYVEQLRLMRKAKEQILNH